jgi:hypothetical protein
VREMPLDQILWELKELERRWEAETKAFSGK